ncbi:MAG: TCP-1/cpn60 chaperonin family protein, partial [Euryarchaeota archaeon]|nr:TCP-1/cpn60 chaperonin family protein [Euryarchaeota archaeon]
MAARMGGQPVYILAEGAQRILGKDARRMNIMAARVIAEAVKTTLGPKGMDKMLVSTTGDVIITNDGAAILKEVEIKHPAAKMMVEVAKTQEKEAGDGTTTAVVFAGELLKRAEELLDQDVHATVIARGYRMAGEEATKVLKEMSREIQPTDEGTLRKVALTSLYSKAPGVTAKEHLADLAVQAVKLVAEKRDGELKIDKEDIKIQKHAGKATRDSEVVHGIVLDKERTHPNMPKLVENAKIALLNTELKIKKTETDAKLGVTTPEQLRAFLDKEEETLKNMVKNIAASGANCVFCQKDIDDMVQYFLAKENIFAVKSLSEKDLKLIAKATGSSIVTNLKDITQKDLGRAARVEERKISGKEFIFIEGCQKPKAVTLFIRGGTEHIIDEIERSMDDAISVVRNVIEDRQVLPGGGAPEVEIAKKIREFSSKVSGREQLAIMEFANAIEVVPKALAENAGLDPINTLIELRAEHENGRINSGIELSTGKTQDMYKLGVIEPLRVKEQVVKSATEVANMILRIDDVIAAKGGLGGKGEEMPMMPPGGMGGMPPMY